MSAFPNQLQALLRPQAYPHPVGAVELIETHISWVLLTGEFAYKIKRPVRYPFVDLRSSERRAFLCHEEVRLNRRFAPELYLDVWPIALQAGEACLGGEGAVIEHAVRMRQFAREDELDRLLAAGRIEPAALESFGSELARIHARLPAAEPAQLWGRPDALQALILDNAEQCARSGDALGEGVAVRALQAPLATTLERTAQRLSERFASGRVRECHGDLHARNIVCFEGRLRAFDCLEFEPALRWLDLADEIAFLLADLEARQRPLHAWAFLNGYLGESGDYEACALLPLFKAHRALVRAKVAALVALQAGAANASGAEAQEPDASNARSTDTQREYRAYVECARRSLECTRPTLVLMSGLSGSGKTWLAGHLAPRLRAVHLRSDIERKRMAGLPTSARADAVVAEALYMRKITAAVYARLEQSAADILAAGYGAIVDATFARRADRSRFRELAVRLGVRLCMVHCQASQEVLQARILERGRRGDDASDAGLSVLAWQQRHFEPVEPQEGFRLFDIVTTEAGAVERLVGQIAAAAAGPPNDVQQDG